MKDKFKLTGFILISFISMFIIFYIVVTSIPENPIRLRYSFFNNKEMRFLVPQGWSFFTKDPREEEIYIYELNNSDNKKIRLNNIQFNQLLGVKRENRIRYTKTSNIIQNIDPSLFLDFNGNAQKFVNQNNNKERINEISINVKKPSLCGKYLIEIKEPIPWSWLSIKENIKMPSKLIIIEFKCY